MPHFDFASEDVLLGIDEVCRKLGISRSTLERLRRPRSQVPVFVAGVYKDEFAGLPVFPDPTVVLGRSPRWSAKVLNDWLRQARR